MRDNDRWLEKTAVSRLKAEMNQRECKTAVLMHSQGVSVQLWTPIPAAWAGGSGGRGHRPTAPHWHRFGALGAGVVVVGGGGGVYIPAPRAQTSTVLSCQKEKKNWRSPVPLGLNSTGGAGTAVGYCQPPPPPVSTER